MKYLNRVVDKLLEEKLESFGAALIIGPKGCGKTSTAKQKAASFIEFQDEDKRDEYLTVAQVQPSKLLIGEKPRLFDEWQDAPKIWGAIRKSIDDMQMNGQYILTGSTSQPLDTPHSGTLRISTLQMYPMSLYESGESSGDISLIDLFNAPDVFESAHSSLTVNELIFAICRGGWPQTLNTPSPKAKLEIAKDLVRQTYRFDISRIDSVKRNPIWAETILRSYARNICTLADSKTVYHDVKSSTGMSEPSFFDYISALEKLFIIEDVQAWSPAIRSKTAIRASKKRNYVDPSIAVAALGIGPDYFNTDFKTLGFLFESLVIRDLKIYSAVNNGRVSYYRDRYGLESDIVLHLEDGRYALIEVKLGSDGIEEGASHLLNIESLIKNYNEQEKQIPLRLPDLKIVITASEYGYRRSDGVLVIPIGCLKN